MIISGKSRGNGVQLGQYLLQQRDNDFIYVHSVQGFASDDISEAMQEADLIASGTRAKKHLFSLSLNPPRNAKVTAEEFDAAIRSVEDALGLAGQPRIAVIHEKGERDRHMHVVFSRINSEEMKAIPLPYNRMKLKDVSRSLFIKHGWDLPAGYIDRSKRNPLRYSLEEYRHAKRAGVHPQEVKAALQDAWAISDNSDALSHALQERGFRLARGDRRGFLAVDHNGEAFSIPKWVGVKTRAVRDRLGDSRSLPSIAETKATIGREMQSKMDSFKAQLHQQNEIRKADAKQTREDMLARQRAERASELQRIEERHIIEARERQERFRSGLGFVWDMLRGENRRIKTLNEREALTARLRDTQEREAMIASQRQQRRSLLDRHRKQAITLRETYSHVVADRDRYIQMQPPTRHQNEQIQNDRKRGREHEP